MSEEYTEPIFSMIIYCASVNISREDGLPDVVCESCKTRLETSYLFKRDCEQSDAKLRMKIEIDYNFKQENNNDSENCIETINTENIKLENDTNLHNYENNEESLDTVYPNMFATAEIHDSKTPIEASTIASENVFVGNSDNHVTDKEDNETDTEYRPKKLNRKRKKKAINLARLRKLICYVCIKTFPTQNDYNAHIAQHPNQKYSCDQENCNMEFSNYIKYAIHRKNIHLIEHYLTCKDCQKSFNNKKSFDRHVLNLHGDRPYGCLKCSKTFREESALTNHVEKTHSKEYKCEFCEKVFSTSFRLSTHRRLHTQEKPYICQDCGKSWIDKSSLTKHIDAHHSDY
ncbi:zinc finger protein 675-like isoform X2 [Chrysoperla carnea]|uniref:zinc finger protein 675-like isoform X2 n=1 Tax=Chrysoperla carnea TaxID=189513 RepID=UPI001D080785|nr:zinc finger protein 675-like isoform X2 [Chrysoperla carnea]